MRAELIITNARIVTPDEVVDGSAAVRDGRITALDETPSNLPVAIDFERDYLLPGLIEMHTDNLEKHLSPRPGVLWPSPLGAMLTHDVQIAGAGITTVYDAVTVGQYRLNLPSREVLRLTAGAIRDGNAQTLLRAEHLLHLRCELSDPKLVELFERWHADPLVRLASVMDHTPGQRQWTDPDKYRLRESDRRQWSDAEFKRHMATLRERQQRYAAPNRRAVVDLWRARGLPLASHDDATEAHVTQAHTDGATIAEFPTTTAAAHGAKSYGMSTVLGAPNVVRGSSHSGNVSALDLAREGMLDALSSDYVPISLLHGVFVMHEHLGMPLPDSVAHASRNTARMLGLSDRGELAIGKRADLVRVRPTAEAPAVTAVWRGGQRVI